MHNKAFKLAASGKSNAEIFGALEISSGALSKLLQSDPKLVFSIINGRSEYIQALHDTLLEFAHEGDRVPVRGQIGIIMELMTRADQANKALTVAHDMCLMQGTNAASEIPRDPATVTQLLRAK